MLRFRKLILLGVFVLTLVVLFVSCAPKALYSAKVENFSLAITPTPGNPPDANHSYLSPIYANSSPSGIQDKPFIYETDFPNGDICYTVAMGGISCVKGNR